MWGAYTAARQPRTWSGRWPQPPRWRTWSEQDAREGAAAVEPHAQALAPHGSEGAKAESPPKQRTFLKRPSHTAAGKRSWAHTRPAVRRRPSPPLRPSRPAWVRHAKRADPAIPERIRRDRVKTACGWKDTDWHSRSRARPGSLPSP